MGRDDSSRASSMNSIVGAGSVFNGTLRMDGGLRVDGMVDERIDSSSREIMQGGCDGS